MEKTMLTIPCKVELEELNNLFFELCTKSCNLKCKNCYIEKNPYKNEEDFIPLEKVKENLNTIKSSRPKNFSIYLTGGEPMLHPDFNKILRMCLKFANTCILTNGTLINDKKARFLRKIDDESSFETIYRISIDSIDEIENDLMRGRGSFRKALLAITSLLKYEFNPIISIVNYKNRKREEIFEEFRTYFSKRGFNMEEINLKIIPYFRKDVEEIEINDLNRQTIQNLDCSNSRIVTNSGVYSCPVFVEDYRKRLGASLNDCSKTNYLDCNMCRICVENNAKAMANDWM